MPFKQRRVVLDEEDFNIDTIYGEEVQELDRQRLYVKNIPPQLTDDGVHNYFSQCGNVKSIYVNREQGKHYGLIDYTCVADAQRACMELNNAPPFHLRLQYAFKKKPNFSSGQSSGFNIPKWDYDDENAMMSARKQMTGASTWRGNIPVRGRAKQYFQQYEMDDDYYDDENISMAGGDVNYVDEEIGELTSRLQQLVEMKKNFNTARTVVASKGKCLDPRKVKVVIQQNPAVPSEPAHSVTQHLQKPVLYEKAVKCAENLTVQYRSPKFGLADLEEAVEEYAKQDIAVPDSPPEMLRLYSMCLVCNSEASTVCGGCRTAPYCSPRCQRSDWTARHAKLCHNLANTAHDDKRTAPNVSRQCFDSDEESGPSRNVARFSGQYNHETRDGAQANRNGSSADKSAGDGARRGYANKAGNRGLNPTRAPSRPPNHSPIQNRLSRDEHSFEQKKDVTPKNESWEKPGANASPTSVPHTPASVQKQEAQEEKTSNDKPEESHVEVQQGKIEHEPTAAAPVVEKVSTAPLAVAKAEKPAVVKVTDVEQRLCRPGVVSGSVVVLTSVESPSRLFVRRVDQMSAYETTLHAVAVHGLTAPALREAPSQGTIVLAEFGEDVGVFYRAAVMRTNVQADKYKLEYLEYGNVDKSCLEKMRKIGPEFEPGSLPVLVSRVALAGYEGDKFNERAMDYLTQLKDGEINLVLTIPDGSESAPNGSAVHLAIESTKKSLLSEVTSVSSPPWKKLDVPEQPDAVLALPVLALDSVRYVEVPATPCVLQVLDTLSLEDGTFNCFHADSEIAKQVLLSLEEELIKYAEETTLGRDPYLPRELELCVAKYQEDSLWYRAVCLQSEAGCPNVLVMFLDYGNVVSVPTTDLRKMLPDFMEGKPAVASLATIEGFPPDPSDALIAAIRSVLEVDGAGARVQCEKAVSGGGECVVSLPEVTRIIESMK